MTMTGQALPERFEHLAKALANKRPVTRADIDHLLAQLGKHLGLTGLKLNEDGMAQLRIDNEIDLLLVHYAHLPGLVVAAAVNAVDGNNAAHLKINIRIVRCDRD